jgi:hypothetical protein
MRHGIDLKPIHNVKDAGQIPADRPKSDPISFTGDGPQEADLVEPAGIEPATSSLQS